jgi:hypothetical protein
MKSDLITKEDRRAEYRRQRDRCLVGRCSVRRHVIERVFCVCPTDRERREMAS